MLVLVSSLEVPDVKERERKYYIEFFLHYYRMNLYACLVFFVHWSEKNFAVKISFSLHSKIFFFSVRDISQLPSFVQFVFLSTSDALDIYFFLSVFRFVPVGIFIECCWEFYRYNIYLLSKPMPLKFRHLAISLLRYHYCLLYA